MQPVKTNIVISYNIYDFDWYVQVTSVVWIPTSRDNKTKTDANFAAKDVEDIEEEEE